ncbi:hypothetical protein IMSHALPRED_003968 [Imshaugia aleurites]|uniref:Uncharacterized protein n=1 Tax=Imshaugia aleurites TaxID=172621 RepID=A0A8H3I735_9LECA|nr:hypothetical protein IMSHALPRED_003968 [Imshaugia aleurites]
MSTNTRDPTPLPTPLGTLITLPPELRNQIYSHVLSKNYIVFWTRCDDDDDDLYPSSYPEYPTTPPDLPARRVSKALNAEASAILFHATTFTFKIGFGLYVHKLSPPPPKEITEKMMNVALEVFAGADDEDELTDGAENDVTILERPTWEDEDFEPIVTADGEVRRRVTVWHPAIMNSICQASVDHFTGIEIERNSLLINWRDFNIYSGLFMNTRFFQTIKECVGFRTVTVLLEGWEWPMGKEMMMKRLQGVQAELEQAWGPYSLKDVYDHSKWDTDDGEPQHHAFELKFRPLKFCRENRKAGDLWGIKEDRVKRVR